MTEREAILGRISEALRVRPAEGRAPHAKLGPAPSIPHPAREWLPEVGESLTEQLALFARNAAELKADFRMAGSAADLRAMLLEIKEREGWKKIGIHSGALLDPIHEALALPVCRTDSPYDVRDLESCDAGISGCDALIAQTGSVLVTNRSAGGRALSVLPPHHVVVAERSQMLPDLPAAFALLQERYAASYPSFISLITGPSRTGDIERILVLGAHGPKRLTILCV